MENVLLMLHAGGYKGTLSFEWEKKWEPALEEPEVAFPRYVQLVGGWLTKHGIPRG
jgi:hypothetical protein